MAVVVVDISGMFIMAVCVDFFCLPSGIVADNLITAGFLL